MLKAFLFYDDNDECDVTNVILISADRAQEAGDLGAVGRKQNGAVLTTFLLLLTQVDSKCVETLFSSQFGLNSANHTS